MSYLPKIESMPLFKHLLFVVLLQMMFSPLGNLAAEEIDLLTDKEYCDATPEQQLARINELQEAGKTIRDAEQIKRLAAVAFVVSKGQGDPVKEYQATVEFVKREKSGDGVPQMGSFRRGLWKHDLLLLPVFDYLRNNDEFTKADPINRVKILSKLHLFDDAIHFGNSRRAQLSTPVLLDSLATVYRESPLSERGMARLKVLNQLRNTAAGSILLRPIDAHTSWAFNEHVIRDKAWQNSTDEEKLQKLVQWDEADLLGKEALFGIYNSGNPLESTAIPIIARILRQDPKWASADFNEREKRYRELIDQKFIKSGHAISTLKSLVESDEDADVMSRMAKVDGYAEMSIQQQLVELLREQDRADAYDKRLYVNPIRSRIYRCLHDAADNDKLAISEEITLLKNLYRESVEKADVRPRNIGLNKVIDLAIHTSVANETDSLKRAKALVKAYADCYGHAMYTEKDVATWYATVAALDHSEQSKGGRGKIRYESLVHIDNELGKHMLISSWDKAFCLLEHLHHTGILKHKSMRSAAESLAELREQGMQVDGRLEAAFWIRAFERDSSFPKNDKEAREQLLRKMDQDDVLSYGVMSKIQKHFDSQN